MAGAAKYCWVLWMEDVVGVSELLRWLCVIKGVLDVLGCHYLRLMVHVVGALVA